MRNWGEVGANRQRAASRNLGENIGGRLVPLLQLKERKVCSQGKKNPMMIKKYLSEK
jgi:hypothetical protein